APPSTRRRAAPGAHANARSRSRAVARRPPPRACREAPRGSSERSRQRLARELDERARGAVLVAPGRADEQDLTLEVEPVDTRLDERAGGEVCLDRRPRDERDAVARANSVRDGLLQAELDAHVEIAQSRARAAQRLLDHLADAGAVLHEDQVLAAHVVERDRPAGEWMAGRADEDDRVAQERLVLDTAVTGRGAD